MTFRPWLTRLRMESVICISPAESGTVRRMASKISGAKTYRPAMALSEGA